MNRNVINKCPWLQVEIYRKCTSFFITIYQTFEKQAPQFVFSPHLYEDISHSLCASHSFGRHKEDDGDQWRLKDLDRMILDYYY